MNALQAIQASLDELRRESKRHMREGRGDVAVMIDEVIQMTEVYLLQNLMRREAHA